MRLTSPKSNLLLHIRYQFMILIFVTGGFGAINIGKGK